MRLLLDECFSPEVVHALREQGYEAIGARELGLSGQSDEVIWQAAQKRRRVVVTANYPHFTLLTRLSKKKHPGLINLRLRRESVELITARLLQFLGQYGEVDLRGQVVTITDENRTF